MSNAPMLPGFEDIAPRQGKTKTASRKRAKGAAASRAVTKSAPLPEAAGARAETGGAGDDLNPEQRAAAEARIDRPCLVIAGAGSGKTKTLIARYAFLRACGVPARGIMTVAFNKAAAAEVAQRLTKAVGTKPLLNGTFHSLGLRLLHQIKDRFELPKEILILEDKDVRKIVREAIQRLGVRDQVPDPKLAIEQISSWKNRGMTVTEARAAVRAMPSIPDDEAWETRRLLLVAYLGIYEAYEEEKGRMQRIDFADMLLLPVVCMRGDAAVRRKFAGSIQHILCDEYQDVNDCQYEFLHLLASEGARLFCVGDDFQAIYGWRHARVEHILNFCDEHPEATRVTLSTNYRCAPEILATANRISAGLSEKLENKELRAAKPAGARPVCCEFGTREGEAVALVDRVRADVDGGLGYRDIAVLSRTNRNLRAVEDQMMRARIPYEVAGGSFWERAEILDMLAYLEAIVDPSADTAFQRIINAPSRRIGAQSVERMRRAVRGSGAGLQSQRALGALSGLAQQRARELVECMGSWRQRLREGEPVSSVLAEVVTVTEYREHWRKEPETLIERMENVQELIDAADGFGTPRDLIEHARHARDAAGRRHKDAVVLSTIHRAKGLEWDTVFVIACEIGAMPHSLATTPSELDEERRLAYVALTRAARRLFLSFTWRTGPSDFLLEIADLLDFWDAFEAPEEGASSGDASHWYRAERRQEQQVPRWCQVLGVQPSDSAEKAERAYRERAKKAHPDLGGSHEQMRELNIAIEMARAFYEARRQKRAA